MANYMISVTGPDRRRQVIERKRRDAAAYQFYRECFRICQSLALRDRPIARVAMELRTVIERPTTQHQRWQCGEYVVEFHQIT